MANRTPLIIAHRGASGYLPEHTLEAKSLAFAMGANYLEQDVVASRDDELVVLHDIHLDRVSDVSEKFPERHRDDGRYYARDFDLAELRSLNVHERRGDDGKTAVYPGRFPTDRSRFGIATLAEEIELVQGLNLSTGRSVGIYPEIKAPAWHHENDFDLSAAVLETLARYGYQGRASAAYLQCFDAAEIRRIRVELGCDLKLIQLLAENSWGESATDYEELKQAGGLQKLAGVVDGVGPWVGQLYTLADIDGQPVSTGLVSAAHAAGLDVHPYTFRVDALAPGFEDFTEMVDWFVGTLRIDGLFTDFPDLARAALSG